jgi:large subunit ribosomal protein L4
MKLAVINISGQAKGEVEFADELLIKNGKGTQAVHDTVTAYMANQRLGTASTKQISEVHGSGKKPWKQKGTGRARQGSTRSPLWRHGGTVFGPTPRSYALRVPKAVRRQALCGALTVKAETGAVRLLEAFGLERPSTKSLRLLLAGLGLADGKVLLVLPERDAIVEKSARNLPSVRVLTVRGLNVYDVLLADALIFTPEGVSTLREVLAP